MSHKPDPSKNVNLTIDGIPVTVPEGTRILEAAKKLNINIPTLCEHPKLCFRGAATRALCRICVVECDGRGKLIAACANDVWEGVNVVTNNSRLLDVRKTILKLILANHPQDCFYCIRNKKCELQALAENFGIRDTGYERRCASAEPVIESETLVRDMEKCVRCGRCVEICQEVQTIRAINTSHRSYEYEISTAYKQELKDVSCVFCGGCAAVCPVGAIYSFDQTAQVQAVLDSSLYVMAQFSPSLVSVFEKEFCNTGITAGKIIAALKLLGFGKVYNAEIAANAVNSEICREIKIRKNGASLPLISGCSEGVKRFVRNFYPNLANHLTSAKNVRQTFAALVKNCYAKEAGVDQSNITSVSIVSGISQKFADDPDKTDFALTTSELVRMIKLAGIMIEFLPEDQFDTANIGQPELDCSVKKITVYGYAEARKVMELILKKECETDWVEIESRPASSM
jgi:ferredoxin